MWNLNLCDLEHGATGKEGVPKDIHEKASKFTRGEGIPKENY